jgi:hypothetical protein
METVWPDCSSAKCRVGTGNGPKKPTCVRSNLLLRTRLVTGVQKKKKKKKKKKRPTGTKVLVAVDFHGVPVGMTKQNFDRPSLYWAPTLDVGRRHWAPSPRAQQGVMWQPIGSIVA